MASKSLTKPGTYKILLNFGGTFKRHNYVGGGKTEIILADVKNLVYEKIKYSIEHCGVKEIGAIHYKHPLKPIPDGLLLLYDNVSVKHFGALLKWKKQVEIFIEHFVEDVDEIEVDGVTEKHGDNGTGVTQDGGDNGIRQVLNENVDYGVSQVVNDHVQVDLDEEILVNCTVQTEIELDEDNRKVMNSDVALDDIDSSEDDEDKDLLFDVDDLSDDDDEIREARVKLRQLKSPLFRGELVSAGLKISNAVMKRKRVVEDGDGSGNYVMEYDSPYYSSSEQGSYESTDKDDEYADHAMRRKSSYPVFDRRAKIPQFALKMPFANADDFKTQLRNYGIYARYSLKFIRNTNKQVRVKCKKTNCPWMIYASIDNATNDFIIKTYREEHKCVQGLDNNMISTKWLAANFFGKMRAVPSLKLEQLAGLVKKDLNIQINPVKCLRARNIVVEMIRGDTKAEYAKLEDYKLELESKNGNNTVILNTTRPILFPTMLPTFHSFYIAFDCVKRGFLAGCRRVIGLDGCFLKGVCKGQLLAAVGRDGNNQMFLIAWAVVESETYDTWSWFIKRLKEDLSITDGDGWTVISDQQKGLVGSVNDFLPQAERRCCVRHLYANWRKKFRGKDLQKKFWLCARATYEPQFEKRMEEMASICPDGHDAMMSRDPKLWCRAFFDTRTQCDVIDNNLCEAFNGRIVEARCKSIYTMLEEIRLIIMKRLHKNRDATANWIDDIGGRIRKKLKVNLDATRDCDVDWNGKIFFEIIIDKDVSKRFVVNITEKTCTCRAWQLSGIPCCHAMTGLLSKGLEPEDYVAIWYKKERYLEAYNYMMEPVSGEIFWKKSGKDPCLPPPFKKLTGRPKFNRIKAGEPLPKSGKISRAGRVMTCQFCGQKGHNKVSCPVRKAGGSMSSFYAEKWMKQQAKKAAQAAEKAVTCEETYGHVTADASGLNARSSQDRQHPTIVTSSNVRSIAARNDQSSAVRENGPMSTTARVAIMAASGEHVRVITGQTLQVERDKKAKKVTNEARKRAKVGHVAIGSVSNESVPIESGVSENVPTARSDVCATVPASGNVVNKLTFRGRIKHTANMRRKITKSAQ